MRQLCAISMVKLEYASSLTHPHTQYPLWATGGSQLCKPCLLILEQFKYCTSCRLYKTNLSMKTLMKNMSLIHFYVTYVLIMQMAFVLYNISLYYMYKLYIRQFANP